MGARHTVTRAVACLLASAVPGSFTVSDAHAAGSPPVLTVSQGTSSLPNLGPSVTCSDPTDTNCSNPFLVKTSTNGPVTLSPGVVTFTLARPASSFVVSYLPTTPVPHLYATNLLAADSPPIPDGTQWTGKLEDMLTATGILQVQASGTDSSGYWAAVYATQVIPVSGQPAAGGGTGGGGTAPAPTQRPTPAAAKPPSPTQSAAARRAAARRAAARKKCRKKRTKAARTRCLKAIR